MRELSTAPTLSDSQLVELLALTRQADSVELKVTVPESDQRSAVAALGMDPLDGQIRQAYFFDSPDLALNERGVVLRVRRVQGRADDSVVKLRPVMPADLPEALRSSPSFSVEVDALPGGYVCSGSMKGRVPDGAVKDTVAGERALRKLFTKEQRSFFRAHAPAGMAIDDLSILGPIFILKLKFTPPDYGRRLVAEMWLYPDDTRILEISTKCEPSEAFQVAAETRAFMAARGVDISGEQETKTQRALKFFSERLRAERQARIR